MKKGNLEGLKTMVRNANSSSCPLQLKEESRLAFLSALLCWERDLHLYQASLPPIVQRPFRCVLHAGAWGACPKVFLGSGSLDSNWRMKINLVVLFLSVLSLSLSPLSLIFLFRCC